MIISKATKPTVIDVIGQYWSEFIAVWLLATIMFELGVYLQKKYNLYNGWFTCIYMIINMAVPVYLFLYLISK